MSYQVPCSICARSVRSDTYVGAVYCGPACTALAERRAAHAHAAPGHLEYHPTNDTQAALHRRALRKRGLD